MIKSVTDELRMISQRCMRAARETLDRGLSRVLEELAVDLAVRAAELENRFDR